MVRDSEAIKRIAVKDFDNFQDHRSIIDKNVDELFGNSLISLTGNSFFINST